MKNKVEGNFQKKISNIAVLSMLLIPGHLMPGHWEIVVLELQRTFILTIQSKPIINLEKNSLFIIRKIADWFCLSGDELFFVIARNNLIYKYITVDGIQKRRHLSTILTYFLKSIFISLFLSNFALSIQFFSMLKSTSHKILYSICVCIKY